MSDYPHRKTKHRRRKKKKRPRRPIHHFDEYYPHTFGIRLINASVMLLRFSKRSVENHTRRGVPFKRCSMPPFSCRENPKVAAGVRRETILYDRPRRTTCCADVRVYSSRTALRSTRVAQRAEKTCPRKTSPSFLGSPNFL